MLSTLEYRLLKIILIIFYPCVVKLFITAVATVVADVGAEMIPPRFPSADHNGLCIEMFIGPVYHTLNYIVARCS